MRFSLCISILAVAFLSGCKPVLTEVSPIGSTYSNEPVYTFSSTAEGQLVLGGACASSATTATKGSNTIAFEVLGAGLYDDCTIQLQDASGNESNILNVSSFEITLAAEQFFPVSRSDSSPDAELWKSEPDGTMRLVKNINESSGSDPEQFIEQQGRVFFISNDGIHGDELWVTDGTEAGTFMVKDINPGMGTSRPGYFSRFGDKLLFVADDGVTGSEVWVTDGTEAGTRLVKDIRAGSFGAAVKYPVVFGDQVYFHANNGLEGFELWASDGTPEGTYMVKDIIPGPDSGRPYYLTVFKDELYFRGESEQWVHELWKSDGTESGTVTVKDVSPACAGVNSCFVEYNDKLYFRGLEEEYGSEVWVTDGTTEGTHILIDVRTGSAQSSPQEIMVFNDKLYFTAYDEANGYGLWESDGTSDGTALLTPVGSTGNSTVFNNTLYFTSGVETWKTDGTVEGTIKVSDQDLLDGAKVLGGRLFFKRYNENTDHIELWFTESSLESAQPVEDGDARYIFKDELTGS